MKLYLLYGLGDNDFEENWLMGVYDSMDCVYQEITAPSNAWKGAVYMLRTTNLNQRVKFEYGEKGDVDDVFYYIVKEGDTYNVYMSATLNNGLPALAEKVYSIEK